MCSPTPCTKCGKTTWRGCGQHVDQVMSRVPKNQQCTCDRNARTESTRPSGVLAALFGRKGQR